MGYKMRSVFIRSVWFIMLRRRLFSCSAKEDLGCLFSGLPYRKMLLWPTLRSLLALSAIKTENHRFWSDWMKTGLGVSHHQETKASVRLHVHDAVKAHERSLWVFHAFTVRSDAPARQPRKKWSVQLVCATFRIECHISTTKRTMQSYGCLIGNVLTSTCTKLWQEPKSFPLPWMFLAYRTETALKVLGTLRSQRWDSTMHCLCSDGF